MQNDAFRFNEPKEKYISYVTVCVETSFKQNVISGFIP